MIMNADRVRRQIDDADTRTDVARGNAAVYLVPRSWKR